MLAADILAAWQLLEGSLVGAFLAAFLGLIAGSYAGLLGWRLPRGLPTAVTRSRCTACQKPLGAGELLPVISYLRQAGRCGCGRITLSPRYPLTELALCAAGLWGWLWLGLTPAWLAVMAVCVAVAVVAGISAQHRTVPLGPVVLLFAGAVGVALLAAAETGIGLGARLGGAGLGLGLAMVLGPLDPSSSRHCDPPALLLGAALGLCLGPVALLAVAGLAIGVATLLRGLLFAPPGVMAAWPLFSILSCVRILTV